jgi:signal transduction histidine kinase/CheY-like chemotaxis protein
MRAFPQRPLASRIALVVCAVLAAALAVKVEVTWRIEQAAREAALLEYGRTAAGRLAREIDRGTRPQAADRALGAPVPGTVGEIDEVHLVDRRGLVTWSDRPDLLGLALPPPPIPRGGFDEPDWVARVRATGPWAGLTEGRTRLIASAPLAGAARTKGSAVRRRPSSATEPRVVVVGWDLSREAAARGERHLRSHASGLLFALLLGLALWWAMRRLVSGPLEDLAGAAARGDFVAAELAAHARRDDEIGALARALSRAQDRLDTSRREGAERAARLAGAIDATTDGVVLATRRDEGWIVDHVNARFAALCGRPAAALEGRSVLDGLRSFADRVVEGPTVESWIAHALEHPEFEGTRGGALRPPPGAENGSGGLVLLDVSTRPVRDGRGRAFGRLWIVRDVTLERAHERRLKRQNQELAALDFVARRVARSLDQKAILASALETLPEVLDVSYSVVEPARPDHPGGLARTLAAEAAGLVAGDVIVVRDVASHSGLRAAVPGRVASLAALPLADASGPVAFLVLGRARTDGFDADEIALLRRVVHPVEAALENARLFARTEAQLVENQTLTEVSRSVVRADALEAVLEDILRAVHVRLHYRNAAILLPDESGQVLYVRASVGYHTNLDAIRLPVDGDSVTARALHSGQPVNVPDVRVEPGYVAGSDDIRSELALPLRCGDVLLGVLDVESDRLGAFGPDDERLLGSVASQAAMVLQNARLLVETRARATRFEAVNEIARSVGSTLDPRRLDRAIVSQIARVVPCERYAMLHYDHEVRRTTRTVVLEGGAEQAHDGDAVAWEFEEGLDPERLVAHEAAWIGDLRVAAADRAEARLVAGGLASLVLVPIALDGVVAAAIVAASREVNGFSSEQIRLLETVSWHVGVALKNAQLFARLQESYTQLDEAQDGLVRSEKLRALGEMASGVAHDFNNVLGAILARAQLLQRMLGPGDASAELDVIEKAARDGAATVRRLQDFTRVRRDHGFQPVSLGQLVEDCLSLTRGRWRDEAEHAGVQYDVTTELADVPPVAGEPSELREVLTNLILNALDAMPGGGRLRLVTGHAPAAGEVRLEVIDDGHGMNDEVRARIFDPFYTTKGVRGVGLGLSVVYGIVERHGGRIEVASAPGQGTTMRVVLPAGAEAAGADAANAPEAGGTASFAAAPPGAAGRGTPEVPALHVLVIDDEPGVRSLLAELLRAAGHRAVEMASGREALVALAEAEADGTAGRAFDLVLTDLGMPDMSGWDVARAVGGIEDPPPVVLVTGWGIQLDDQLLAASGVCDVIAKPFTIEDVLAVVGRAARRRAA